MRMLKTLLTTQSVAFATSTNILFSGVTTTVKQQDRIGLVGNNGVGKTTLLHLLEGVLEPDSGTVIRNGSVGYVPQITTDSQGHKKLKQLILSRGCSYEKFVNKYNSIFSSVVPKEESEISNMSGGECTKLWIVLVATTDPDVLLLDEPTNHLDNKSIKELKQWIDTLQSAVVFVSHNRLFLSEVARSIWELDLKTLTQFGCKYESYLQKKKQDVDAKSRKYDVAKRKLKSIEAGIHRRETKSVRATKARIKSKSDLSRDKFAESYFSNRSERGA